MNIAKYRVDFTPEHHVRVQSALLFYIDKVQKTINVELERGQDVTFWVDRQNEAKDALKAVREFGLVYEYDNATA